MIFNLDTTKGTQKLDYNGGGVGHNNSIELFQYLNILID